MDGMIALHGVSVTRGGVSLVRDLDFVLRPGEHWGLIGPNGSGKTTLIGLLRGDILPDPGGMRRYDFGGGVQSTVLGLRQCMGHVSAARQDFYIRHGRRATPLDVILAGFFDAPFLQQTPTTEQRAKADAVMGELGLMGLVDRPMGKLSTGQSRSVLLARALAHGAKALFLDECLDGLDEQARAQMLRLIELAAERTTIVAAAHRASELPSCVRRVAVLDHGRITVRTGKDEGVAMLDQGRETAEPPGVPRTGAHRFDYLVRVSKATVVKNGVAILRDIDWTVLPGENWAVLGRNGAGKSTLLGLVLSETAPYADGPDNTGSVERLGGMTMDEAWPRIGYVSSDLHATYGTELGVEPTVEQTLLSGFRSSVGLVHDPSNREVDMAWAWMEYLGLSKLADVRLGKLSQGQRRLALLARAVVSAPDLLLLDEPMAGLDTPAREAMLKVFERLAGSGTGLVLVAHHKEDLVPSINRVLLLEAGRVAFCGRRKLFDLRQDVE